MRKTHKYCEHNKVRKMADGGKVEKKKKAKKPDPKVLGKGMAAKAGQTIKDAQAKRKKMLDEI